MYFFTSADHSLTDFVEGAVDARPPRLAVARDSSPKTELFLSVGIDITTANLKLSRLRPCLIYILGIMQLFLSEKLLLGNNY